MNEEEFYDDFIQDLYARSGANEDFLETVFTERMCEFLVDQAIIQNYSLAEYRKNTLGIRLDAWDYNDETELLSLFVVDFRNENSHSSLTQTEVDRSFRRLQKFLDKCLTDSFYKSLEESTQGYAAAREIYENRSRITKVQFFLLSNAILSKRVKFIGKENNLRTYHIWDVGRLARIELSGKAREDMVVDFGKGIPCLPAFTGSKTCQSYLLVMPGSLIASLYDKYGERLLEQNVRTFLQFRGNVNKGIRNTIQNRPDMFFAYNNGLTTTAENVEISEDHNLITSATNLQIVNGGQTTAALFTANRKSKLDLTNVYVQVKLSVIPPEDVENIVPEISKCANTQNKVNAADFFANHAFHLRIESFSRRLWAHSATGSNQDTHWFYERARGQFANAYANMTPAQQKEFLLKNPKSQMFTKTDLAKFQYSFEMLPHIVSKGAQACFAHFANKVGDKWDKNEKQFNELYFKQLIAKEIVFRSLDKLIMKQPWYGGYKANIVTYSLAKLAYMVGQTGRNLDLMKIWKEQRISADLEAQLLIIAGKVNEKIQDTDLNVTQYCKQELCWQRVRDMQFDLNEETYKELIDHSDAVGRERDAGKEQVMLNGIEAQMYVLEKGASYWEEILTWNETAKIFTPKETGILKIATQMPGKLPTDLQIKILLKVEAKAFVEGFSG